ncbi:MAG: glycoside hydrolase family 2, partial [Clostridia bacterium]|nr:glycoside hydrolase family 2 [Clostridia bacterium]
SVKGHTFTKKKFGYKRFKSVQKLTDAYEKLYLDEVIPLIENQGLCATVYTQLSDVEDEVNGLFTYDRVLKFDPRKVREINDKVYERFNRLFK